MWEYYPALSKAEIENMTLEEYGQRVKAHLLRQNDQKQIAFETPFVARQANAYDKDGHWIIDSLNRIIDLDKERRQITGEAEAEVNQYLELSRRAERARREAIQQIEKGG